ncbi:MAG: glycosyltransferase family 4 protein [Thermoplasmata archaeon]
MVGWEFPPFHAGGLGVHCQELTRELARLGHRVLFLVPLALPYDVPEGVEIRALGPPAEAGRVPHPAYAPPELYDRGFREKVEEFNAWVAGLPLRGVDVVHVHDWFGTRGAVALARRLRVPLVMTVHSTEVDRSVGHPDPGIEERERWGVSAAQRVIAVSRHLARQLVRHYGADPRRVRVVYNAVRPPEDLSSPEARTRDLVLFLGRLTVMKGPETFLKAVARVAPSFPEIRFVVAGEGPEYPKLVELAATLGIGDRVLFLGKVSEAERKALLGDAAVFVLPSVTEPFGIAVLEAMAAGVPTIVSKTSGVVEVVRSAFQVDFWDVDEIASRIAELLEYPPLRTEMGERGREEALSEGWADRARETAEVYRDAIRSYGAGQ